MGNCVLNCSRWLSADGRGSLHILRFAEMVSVVCRSAKKQKKTKKKHIPVTGIVDDIAHNFFWLFLGFARILCIRFRLFLNFGYVGIFGDLLLASYCPYFTFFMVGVYLWKEMWPRFVFSSLTLIID